MGDIPLILLIKEKPNVDALKSCLIISLFLSWILCAKRFTSLQFSRLLFVIFKMMGDLRILKSINNNK